MPDANDEATFFFQDPADLHRYLDAFAAVPRGPALTPPLALGEKVYDLLTGAEYRLASRALHPDRTVQTYFVEPLASFEAFLTGMRYEGPGLQSIPPDTLCRSTHLAPVRMGCLWCGELGWHWRTTQLPDYLRCEWCRGARPLIL
jgi:hypothetical protein